MKILSVDDSKTIRLIVKRAFAPYDCTVCEATNGEEGLAAAANERPDLIVLDITMPVMDGVEATRIIREKYPDIQIVALTSSKDEEIVKSALQAGA